jgi:hypothetical protein
MAGMMLMAAPGAKPHSVCGRSSVKLHFLPRWKSVSQSI